jgi:purine-nucleoside phosphorylase
MLAPIDDAVAYLRERLPEAPKLLLTLGSGLDGVADAVEDPVDLPVAEIPGLVASTVEGHAAILRFGKLFGHAVLVQRGRVHLYEDHPPAVVVGVVRVAAALGASGFVVTNAAGGLDPDWTPGDLMVIRDQVNLTGTSLPASVLPPGVPFVDMSDAYDPEWQAVAGASGDVRSGVYMGIRGPAFETPAEVAMLRTLGGDAVGMSTVLEVIAARAASMRVLGLSSITNVHHPGLPVSHEEVLEVGAEAAARMAELLLGVLPDLH